MEKYPIQWFRERAINSFKKIKDGIWDYSDALTFYIPGNKTKYESIQEKGSPYYDLITQPERNYLKDIAREVVEQLPSRFEYIDLGPGTEHKEQFIFDEVKQQNKDITYVPVDINQHFLKLAADHATEQGIKTVPLRCTFEELPARLEAIQNQRFVSLGLTYQNYIPSDIFGLLKKIAGQNSFIFIEIQARDRVDMNEIVKAYSGEFFDAEPKLRLLDIDPHTDTSPISTNDEIEVWITLQHPPKILEKIGAQKGDEILIFRSLRPTRADFEKTIKKDFSDYVIFDTHKPFVGVLLKT